MTGVLPYVTGGIIFACIVAIAIASDFDLTKYASRFGTLFVNELLAADMTMKATDYALGIVAFGTIAWLGATVVLHPTLTITIVAFVLVQALAVVAAVQNLRLRRYLRLKSLHEQLEVVFRTLAGAVRVGVSLRQALVLVAEEIPNPARREFRRVVGRCNVGVPLVDAIDELAKSTAGSELLMFARVIRVQQQTGGDLSDVLETLASTIRDRRRVKRKMGALTAQGRFGAVIVGGLPLFIGGFVITTQQEMGHALLHTTPGLGMLGGVALLEAAAMFTLSKIVQLDV